MKKHHHVIISIISCLLLNQIALAETTTVFGMFQSSNNGDDLVKQLKDKTDGCILRREGKTNGLQGNYELQPISHFFIIECENNSLAKGTIQPLIDELNKTTKNLVLLEGPTNQSDKRGLVEAGIGRDYIFKLSAYNNNSPQQRRADLHMLSKEASHRKYHYTTEAAIQITDAYGMRRPDELTVIYYQSQEEGQKFRNDNVDLMQKISHFNRKHVVRFSYIAAESNR